jgi:DNA-directed RNA polymerase subunit L
MSPYKIPDQGHTLACLLRALLFEHGATEAACVVLHPQDTDLTVYIRSEDQRATLRNAIVASMAEIGALRKSVRAHQSFATPAAPHYACLQ